MFVGYPFVFISLLLPLLINTNIYDILRGRTENDLKNWGIPLQTQICVIMSYNRHPTEWIIRKDC